MVQNKQMGLMYADIELINADDEALARRHIIGEDEIRSLRTTMLVKKLKNGIFKNNVMIEL